MPTEFIVTSTVRVSLLSVMLEKQVSDQEIERTQ